MLHTVVKSLAIWIRKNSGILSLAIWMRKNSGISSTLDTVGNGRNEFNGVVRIEVMVRRSCEHR